MRNFHPWGGAAGKRKSLTPPPRGNVKQQKMEVAAVTQENVDKFFG